MRTGFCCAVAAGAIIASAHSSRAQVDVTAPGDPIVLYNGTNDGDGNSGAPPAGEIVDHAIDNVRQKYLNFLDLGSGFIVSPRLGGAAGTVITGARFYTANDAEARDPASYLIEGSNTGDAGPWTLISSGPLQLPIGRNITSTPYSGTTPIDALTDFQQTVAFVNATPYTSYRVSFPTLKDATAANSMQIAEVELLGVAVPEPSTAGIVMLATAGWALGARRRR